MHPLRRLAIAALLAGVVASAQAAHTQARLILAAEAAKPGDTVLAGIQLRMDPQWHTYWKNSGASGIPTSIQWDLPAGITAGEIQWPVPEKLPPDDLVTYVYHDEVVLLVPLKLADTLQPGPRELKARIAWLECKEQCIPGRAELTATLAVGPDPEPSPALDLIQSWQKKLPQPGAGISARAWWEGPAKADLRALILDWNSSPAGTEADFYPFGSDNFEVQGATERLPSAADSIRLRKPVKKFQGDWPGRISGLLIQKTGAAQIAHEVTLPIQVSAAESPGARRGEASEPGKTASGPDASISQPLWRMMLYALVGGLILNIMPCVLPVIALKILGFVSEARSDPGHVRRLGLIYTAGVLVSFLALAALVIGVKAAGHRAGWGMQFSNPQFLVVLIVLVTLVSLNLFGLFEVNLGGRAMGAAGALASKQGPAGAFFNGVLATVLATPCTAPFLGAALGFAFAQSAAVIVLMFLTVGFGLALPYLVLSWQPAWLRLLPRPGPWMERFKILLGFPMLATALWLLSLVPSYYGKRAWWLGMFLLIVALAAWMYGEFVQRARARRGLALTTIAVLLLGGYLYAVEKQLDWRAPLPATTAGRPLKDGAEGIDWEPWNRGAVAHAQSEGHPVLVDFTADWCLTCQANKKFALEVDSVRSRLKQIGAATFLGDYTRFPEDMTVELNRHGRAGVPLVLVYPARAGAAPIVLPEILTPGIVLEALARAAQ